MYLYYWRCTCTTGDVVVLLEMYLYSPHTNVPHMAHGILSVHVLKQCLWWWNVHVHVHIGKDKVSPVLM